MITLVLAYFTYDWHEFTEVVYATGSRRDLNLFLKENKIPEDKVYEDLSKEEKGNFIKREYCHYRILKFERDGKKNNNT